MPNPTFPDIALPDIGLGESWEDGEIATPMEVGYEQTRPRYTRDRGRWPLKWETEPLTAADYATLMAFRETVRGGQILDWTHPVTHTVYTVRAKFGEFRWVDVGGVGGWAGSVDLREV